MSFAGMLVHIVSLIRPGAMVDRYGDTLPDWNNPTTTAAKAWISQRGASEDQTAGRNAYIGEWIAYLDDSVTPQAGDRLAWGSTTFEIDGPPLPAYRPTGGTADLHHWETNLKVIEG